MRNATTPKPGKHRKKTKGNFIDALWGPLGLLLIFVVMAVSAAAITMMYDSVSEMQENQ